MTSDLSSSLILPRPPFVPFCKTIPAFCLGFNPLL